MAHRFLVVTHSGAPAEARFPELGDADRCGVLPADASGRATFDGIDSWESLLDSLSGWRPDVLVLLLPQYQLPDWLGNSPIPVIGVVTELRKHWYACRADLDRCNALLVDALPAAFPDSIPVAPLPQRGSWSAHLEWVTRDLTGRGERRFDPVASLLGRVPLGIDEPEPPVGGSPIEEVVSHLARRPRDSHLLNALAV